MALTYRNVKGEALTINELDANFQYFTGSHAITGSLVVSSAVSASAFTGSFVGDGSNLTGVTGEWDGSLNGDASITGSLVVSSAITASTFTGSFVGDGSNLITPSLATTGSNTFIGDQVFSGSLTITGSSAKMVSGLIEIDGKGTGESELGILQEGLRIFRGSSASDRNQNITINYQGGVGNIVAYETNANAPQLRILLSSSATSYTPIKLQVGVTSMSGSLNVTGSTTLSGSLYVSGGTTGSFTGSFTGNGAGLTGLVSASYATSSSIATTADTATSASYATTASYALNAPSSDPFPYTGSVGISGSTDIVGNLTVTGNTAFGNALTDTTTISGSVYLRGNAGSSVSQLKVTNAVANQTSGSIDITSNSPNNIPSIFLRTNDNVPYLFIGEDGSGAAKIQLSAVGQTDGNLKVQAQNGGLYLLGSQYIGIDGNGATYILNLPTTEPATSGMAWLSGSAGSNSKILCVRD